MGVLVGVDKIGRACALPVLAALLLANGAGATGVVLLWGVTIAVATVVTIGLRRGARPGAPPTGTGPPPTARTAASSSPSGRSRCPRAAGQSFDVAVLWLDTLLVAALIGPTAAGIYAAGTRFLLIGTFTAEAIQQAVAPRVSSLITLGKHDEAHAVITQATSWQAAITWPVYLVVIAFSGVLLGIFGPDYVQAQWALILLSVGLLVAVVGGPSDAVILMSGRSRQSLANSTIAFSVNLVGNLLLVPVWGISAAGGVWAATLVVAAGLPALQARRSLGLAPVVARAAAHDPRRARHRRHGLRALARRPRRDRRRPRRRDRPRHRRLRRASCGSSGSRSTCRHCSTACGAPPGAP